MRYTHLIWDFNGTVLDDISVGMESINVLLARRSLPLIPGREKYRSHFGFPIIEYYKTLGFDFEKESYDDVAVEWVKEYLRRVPEAPLHIGVRETMKQVAERGMPQILLSATYLDMLLGQVEHLDLTGFFADIYGLDNIHAKSKKMLAERLRTAYPDGRFLFVGDTDHDFEVSRAAGGDCLLFSGGHQSKKRLEALGCPIIDDIPDLLAYL